MSVKLPTEHNLEFLSLKGSSESTLVKWNLEITCHGSNGNEITPLYLLEIMIFSRQPTHKVTVTLSALFK